MYKYVLALFLILAPAAMATTLTGGTDYNEYLLDQEDGKEQHGTRVIDWNHWVDRIQNKAYSLLKQNQYEPGSKCFYKLDFDNERHVICTIVASNNNFFSYCVKEAYEVLNGTTYLEFPRGTQRTEFGLTTNSWEWKPYPTFWRSHARGFEETQSY